MFHFVNGHYVLPFDEMITCGAVIARTKYGEWNPDIQYEYVFYSHLHRSFSQVDIAIYRSCPLYTESWCSHRPERFRQAQNNQGQKYASITSDSSNQSPETDVRGLRRKLLRTLRTQRSYGSTFFRASDEIRNRRTCMSLQFQPD